MAVRAFDSASEDVIKVAAPAYFLPGHTIAAVVKRAATTGYHGFFSIGSSEPNPHLVVEFTNDGRVEYVWPQLYNKHSYAADSAGTEWQLVVVSMPVTFGDAAPRLSIFDGSDWTHADGDTAFSNGSAPEDWTGLDPELRFGNWDASFNFLEGEIARVALWRTDPLDEAEVEALAGGSKADWEAAGADHLWEFDQASTDDPVQDFIGSCDQTAISGTSVVLGDDPPGSIISMTDAPDTTAPVATVTTPPSETTVNQGTTTVFEFQANEAIQAWKVKVVPDAEAEHDEGTVIGTSNGSLNVTGGALGATTDQSVTIHGADLDAASPGAGSKVVKVFAQDLAGNWSAL